MRRITRHLWAPLVQGQTGYIDTDLTYNPSTALLRVVQGGITGPILQIENTNANANPPVMNLYKNKAGATAGDGIGALAFTANNSSAAAIQYARIQTDCRDSTAASENGSISVLACVNSPTPTEFFRFNGAVGTGANELYKLLETRGVSVQNSIVGQNLNLNQVASGGAINITNIGNNAIALSSTGGGSSIITGVATNYITLVSGSGNTQGGNYSFCIYKRNQRVRRCYNFAVSGSADTIENGYYYNLFNATR
jgi:hypothetical protein